MAFQLAIHALSLKNKDNNLWERILQTICNPGSLLDSLEVENVTCCLQKCHKETRGQLLTVNVGHGMKNHENFHYPYLLWGPLPRSITSNMECQSPTHTHEKLNSLRWEIILNATTWLAVTTVHQSTVVIFVDSGFEIALLCAHLLNQNLLLPYRKTILQPKYSLQDCSLVLVMLLLM